MCRGLSASKGSPPSLWHHLPQLLEEVEDEDEALGPRSIAFRDGFSGGISCEDEPIPVSVTLPPPA